MKHMARMFLACLLAALMVLAVLPATLAFAAEETTVTLDPGYVEIWIGFGEECRLAATVTGADPDQALRFVSSDPTVATVSDDGNIVPVAEGQTYITAYATDGSGAVSNAVLVRVLPEVVISEDQLITLGSASGSRINKDEFLAWPEQYGEAHIALWYGGAVGAVTITVDDNISGDFPRWNHYLATYGIPVTFFVPTAGGGKSGEIWEDQIALGQAVQSHTYDHPSSAEYGKMTSAQIWMDFYRSVKDIELYTPSASKVVAYSYGHNDPPYTSKIFIAGRGTAGHSNGVNSINYNTLSSFSCGKDTDFETYVKSVYDSSYTVWGKTCIGNWSCMHFHGISGDNDSSGLAKMMSVYLPEAIAAKNVWAGLFEEVAMYGQERDSATLTVHSVDGDSVVLSVTDKMNDTLYDFPLSVKVRVDDTWQYAYATQAGRRVGVEIYERHGATYLIVDAVPDRGAVVVTRTESEMPEIEATPSYAPTFGLGDHNMSAVADGAAVPAAGDVITISSVRDWEALAAYVAAGNTGSGLTFVLTTDLDLSSIDYYTPVGRSSAPFGGTFDGRGHTVRVAIERGTDRVGLFGNISGATVRNVHVEGDVAGRAYVGGVVGVASGSTVEGCTFRGTVSSSGGAARGNNVESLVGGIVGGASTTTIDRCISYAFVTAQKPYAGGIVSCGSNLTVTNCASYATVVGTSYVGSVMGDSTSTSSGNSITLRNNLAAGSVTGTSKVGGLTGAIGNMNGVKVHNNLVTATVTCTDPAGQVGIVTATVTRGGNNVNPTHAYYVGARYGDMPSHTLVGDCTATFFSITEEQLAGTSDVLIHPTNTYAAKTSVLEALNAYAAANGYLAWSYAENGMPVPVTLSGTTEADSTACPHSVVFVSADGAVLATETVECGGAVTAPALPAGATGWSCDTSAVYEDMVVYALTESAYAVTFRGLDGMLLQNTYVAHGGAVKAPEVTVPPFYTFDGWDTSFDEITAPLCVNAVIIPTTYRVTFLGKDGEVIEVQSVVHGKDAVMPEAPVYDHFGFDGWSGDATDVTADVTVQALYSPRVTVTFLDRDGTVLKVEVLRPGEDATAPSVTEQPGYAFAGWDSTFTDVTADLTVRALFDRAYTVTFLDREGNLIGTDMVIAGGDAETPAAPQVPGYAFVGWSASVKGINADVTVQALYTAEYTVTFYGKGGTVLKTEKVLEGWDATAPQIPAVEGYDFTGWSCDFTDVRSDLEVQAVYVRNNDSITDRWDGTADISWYNDTDTVFVLETAEQLAGLAQLVNAGNTFAGKTVKLGAHIKLNSGSVQNGVWTPDGEGNSKPWTPIGTLDTPFCGTFDGQNHTVSGILFTDESTKTEAGTQCVGLFGYAKDASFANLKLADSYIYNKYAATVKSNSEPYNYTALGLLVGYLDGVTGASVTGVHTLSGYVYGTSTATSGIYTVSPYVGGVVGYAKGYVTLSDCSNGAEIHGINPSGSSGYGANYSTYVGGVVGRVLGASKTEQAIVIRCTNTGYIHGRISHGNQQGYLGGVVGEARWANLSYLTGEGRVAADNMNVVIRAGGIVGLLQEGSSLTDCVNRGSVTAEHAGGIAGRIGSDAKIAAPTSLARLTNYGEILADSTAGGIAGEIYAFQIIMSCTDLYNYGAVIGLTAGGIAGSVSSTASNSKQYVQMERAYNYGTVTGTGASTAAYAGGIAGKMTGGTILDGVINRGSVTGPYAVGGLVGYIGSKGGNSQQQRIYNSANMGSVTATGLVIDGTYTAYAGGIAGIAWSGEMINNGSYGSVTVADSAEASRRVAAGGVIGLVEMGVEKYSYDAKKGAHSYTYETAGKGSFSLTNCLVTAELSAPGFVGGVIGLLDDSFLTYDKYANYTDADASANPDTVYPVASTVTQAITWTVSGCRYPAGLVAVHYTPEDTSILTDTSVSYTEEQLTDGTVQDALNAGAGTQYEAWHAGKHAPMHYMPYISEIRVYAASVVLGDRVAIRLYVENAGAAADADVLYRLTVDGLELVGTVEGDYIVYTVTDIPADALLHSFSVEIAVSLGEDGEFVTHMLTYGVGTYIERMAGKDAKLDALLGALADYAKAAAGEAVDVDEAYAAVVLTPVEEVDSTYATFITMELTDSIRPIIKVADGVAQVTVEIYGRTYTYDVADGEVVIDCLTATSLNNEMRLTFLDGEGNILGTTGYSVANYLVLAEQTTVGKAQNLVRALAVYMQAVRTFNGLE